MDRLNESITDDESPYDCIIWLGDMNYRINGVTGAIMHAMRKNMYEVLIDNDQLSIERKIGRLNSMFKEGPIMFAPTYKLKKFADEYVFTERIPGWTDRILHFSRPENSLQQQSYDSNTVLKLSDHRPVFSQFDLKFDFSDGFATLRSFDGLNEMINAAKEMN